MPDQKLRGRQFLIMCQNSVDFRRGNTSSQLVLLGACPGQEEWAARPQRPFAGQSGINLRNLLAVLDRLAGREMYGLRRGDFRSQNIDDYTLMNAHPVPKWPARDGRSTPRMVEVESADIRIDNPTLTQQPTTGQGYGREIWIQTQPNECCIKHISTVRALSRPPLRYSPTAGMRTKLPFCGLRSVPAFVSSTVDSVHFVQLNPLETENSYGGPVN
jgi:hypothetical protein